MIPLRSNCAYSNKACKIYTNKHMVQNKIELKTVHMGRQVNIYPCILFSVLFRVTWVWSQKLWAQGRDK